MSLEKWEVEYLVELMYLIAKGDSADKGEIDELVKGLTE